MTRKGRVVLASIAVLGALVAVAVLVHWPAAHRVAAHLRAIHGHGPVHGGDSAGAGEGSFGDFGTMLGASPEATARALEGVAALGQRWDASVFDQTVALFADAHRDIEWPGLLAAETIHYGSNPRQTFELFRPEQDFSEPGPVFVFVHGNGLGTSEPVAPGSDGLIWRHIGKLVATFGAIGVTMDYRTGGSPRTAGSDGGIAFEDLEAGAEDLRRVIDWLAANIAPYGGDPHTIVVLANSEGATRVAGYLFNESWQTPDSPGLAAVILTSGLFGAHAPGIEAAVNSYNGERVPLALWHGEFDTAEVTAGIGALHAQLCAKYGECPAAAELKGHNHVSHIMSLGTNDTSVAYELIRFYHTVR